MNKRFAIAYYSLLISCQNANSALSFVEEHVYSERVLARVETYTELLADYPYLGATYALDYPAARPPLPCRHIDIPDTPFTLFYSVNEAEQEVEVFYVDFSAGDPRAQS